jgi:hypothetical protein
VSNGKKSTKYSILSDMIFQIWRQSNDVLSLKLNVDKLLRHILIRNSRESPLESQEMTVESVLNQQENLKP